MFIAKVSLARRTFLRGFGVTLALPLLDAMVPALSAMSNTAANPVRRLGVVYVPNGMAMGYWTPAAEGSGFPTTPILQPLEPFRDQLLVVSGLSGPQGGGGHAGGSTLFLTGAVQENSKAGAKASVSMDQIVAREFGRQTQLASLELALDSTVGGACDGPFSCDLTTTISWRSPTTPLPMESNPRAVFERLFGDTGSTDPTARLLRLQRDSSILDSITETAATFVRGLAPSDRTKITEYLDAVRDIERRIQKAEEQNAINLPVVNQPVGIPASFEEHAKLMFDLQVLAYQCDLTRVITFMIGRELTGRTYAEIGVPDAHHPLSHHQNDPAKIERLSKVNAYHTTLFAYYLEKLRATPDGNGSLLDHMMIVYGAGISESNLHDHRNLPIVLVGGGSGTIKGGRHLKYTDTPIANLLVTVSDKLGVPVERIADSTGELQALSDM
jgi:hypothetical protein